MRAVWIRGTVDACSVRHACSGDPAPAPHCRGRAPHPLVPRHSTRKSAADCRLIRELARRLVIQNSSVYHFHILPMRSLHRLHTAPSRALSSGVWMLVVALLAVGPLSGWSILVDHLGSGQHGPCPHHSSGPHVCPHHAAMQAARAARSAPAESPVRPAVPAGASFCMDHAATDHAPPDHAAMQAADHAPRGAAQIRCTCDHDQDTTPEAVRILDKFVLPAPGHLQPPLHTYTLEAAYASLTPTSRADDIFRPPRA